MEYLWDHQREIRVKATKWIRVKLTDIIYCMADDGYTRLFMADKKDHLITGSLCRTAKLIASAGFYTIHKKYLINLDYYVDIIKPEGIKHARFIVDNFLSVLRRKFRPLNTYVCNYKKAQRTSIAENSKPFRVGTMMIISK